MRSDYRERTHWADPICHPLPLGAALLLAVNDHWLKSAGMLPPLVTGKLSDVCGLFFFPALLLVIVRGAMALLGRRPPRCCLPLLLLGTGLAFVAANLSPPFNNWLSGWWGHKVMDPTDLLVLPVLLLSWLWLRREHPSKPRQLLGPIAVVACGLASAATSPVRVSYPRNYPAWALVDAARIDDGQTRLDLWTSKSGKTGMGLTLLVLNCGAEPRRIELVSGHLRIGELGFSAELPAAREVAPGEAAYLYVPFVFDNERLWNEGRREGFVELQMRLDGKLLRLSSRARHHLDGFHRRVERYVGAPGRVESTDRCAYREVPRPSSTSRPSGTVLEPVPR